jgi:nicotinamide mononucleotide transporter
MGYFQWFEYLQAHYLEILGTLTGLVYIFYSIEQKRILWLYGGISSVFYILVFYRSGLFAYMVLYFYYVVISFYGWYSWAPAQNEGSVKQRGITRLKTRSWPWLLVIMILMFGIIFAILKFIESAEIPMADAFLTAGSIIATWLLMRKIIDHWIIWIIIDLFTAFVSIFKGLPFAAVLFFIYTLLAIKGYLEWKKELQRPIQN